MGTGNAMVWPVPKVTMENVFVRGKGRLVAIKGSRPFELEVKNAIAALDSTLIDIDPSTADPSTAGSGLIHLSARDRVPGREPAALPRGRAQDRHRARSGLARTEVTVDSSLFASAEPGPSRSSGPTGIDSREHAERWFSWRGRNSVYGNDRKRVMMEIRPQDVEANRDQDRGRQCLARNDHRRIRPVCNREFCRSSCPRPGRRGSSSGAAGRAPSEPFRAGPAGECGRRRGARSTSRLPYPGRMNPPHRINFGLTSSRTAHSPRLGSCWRHESTRREAHRRCTSSPGGPRGPACRSGRSLTRR